MLGLDAEMKIRLDELRESLPPTHYAKIGRGEMAALTVPANSFKYPPPTAEEPQRRDYGMADFREGDDDPRVGRAEMAALLKSDKEDVFPAFKSPKLDEPAEGVTP
jgi:hypothetical protein